MEQGLILLLLDQESPAVKRGRNRAGCKENREKGLTQGVVREDQPNVWPVRPPGAGSLSRPSQGRSLVRIQSPRHLRLAVTVAYGKPIPLGSSVPGRLWSGVDSATPPT